MDTFKPCKKSYIGNPIRTYANICQVCHGKGCDHCHNKGNCGCGKCGHKGGSGICEAVVDDAKGLVYLYGNVKHEDYHVPEQACIAFTAVPSAGFPQTGSARVNELFEGVQDGNNVTLEHLPIKNSMAVYLNGLKQIEGQERDFQMTSEKTLHFNFYSLLPTDVVEVVYSYSIGGGE